jgi:hypothetical protein
MISALFGGGKDDKTPRVRGKVTEVEFESPVKVSLGKKEVDKPHWKLGEKLKDGDGSKRPAVLLTKDGAKGKDVVREVTVKVKLTEVKNVSGKANLLGRLGPLEITGECPLSEAEHTVKAKIKELPDGVRWYHRDASWALEGGNLGQTMIILNTTLLEVFVVFHTPDHKLFQGKDGVWAEALRLLCRKAGVVGTKTEQEALEKIAGYCHGRHGLKYDSAGGGGSKYGPFGNGGSFQLGDYLVRKFPFANCYDQAGAVQTLAGCLGVIVNWLYLAPFGYIKPTRLLGYHGMCNNPFFLLDDPASGYTPSKKMVPQNDSKRTAFGNHAFCGFRSKILDACAGPHIGNEDKPQYVAASIDSTTTLYRTKGGRAGEAKDIKTYPGVNEVV